MCKETTMVKVFEDSKREYFHDGHPSAEMVMSMLKFYTWHEHWWRTWTYVVRVQGWAFSYDKENDPSTDHYYVVNFHSDAEAQRWAIEEFDGAWEMVLSERRRLVAEEEGGVA